MYVGSVDGMLVFLVVVFVVLCWDSLGTHPGLTCSVVSSHGVVAMLFNVRPGTRLLELSRILYFLVFGCKVHSICEDWPRVQPGLCEPWFLDSLPILPLLFHIPWYIVCHVITVCLLDPWLKPCGQAETGHWPPAFNQPVIFLCQDISSISKLCWHRKVSPRALVNSACSPRCPLLFCLLCCRVVCCMFWLENIFKFRRRVRSLNCGAQIDGLKVRDPPQ